MLYSYMHTYTHTLTHTHAHTQHVGEQGSMLYSYVHGDAFCERQESAKVVTTSSGERDVPLFKKIMGDNKKKQQVCVCVCHFAPHLLVVAISYI